MCTQAMMDSGAHDGQRQTCNQHLPEDYRARHEQKCDQPEKAKCERCKLAEVQEAPSVAVGGEFEQPFS